MPTVPSTHLPHAGPRSRSLSRHLDRILLCSFPWFLPGENHEARRQVSATSPSSTSTTVVLSISLNASLTSPCESNENRVVVVNGHLQCTPEQCLETGGLYFHGDGCYDLRYEKPAAHPPYNLGTCLVPVSQILNHLPLLPPIR